MWIRGAYEHVQCRTLRFAHHFLDVFRELFPVNWTHTVRLCCGPLESKNKIRDEQADRDEEGGKGGGVKQQQACMVAQQGQDGRPVNHRKHAVCCCSTGDVEHVKKSSTTSMASMLHFCGVLRALIAS